MARETILSVLSRRNPTPRPRSIGPAPNTFNKEWLDFDDWAPWSEFTARKLRALYRDVVDAPWKDAYVEPRLSEFDTTYGDEDGFEHQILSRSTVPAVNAALLQAQKLCNHLPLLHLGRRGRCRYGEDGRIHPDWVLVSSNEFMSDQRFASIMPGDTKLSARWQPNLYLKNREQWKHPIRQVLTYSNEVWCRYGFLITDNELVVFQFAIEHVDPGIATFRNPRQSQQPQHQRVVSTVSDLSDSVQAMSISSRTQSYVETGKGYEYQNPRYRVIPWANHGEGDLTVKSALFYLCMMAGYGSRHVATAYPKLNTWWYLSDGTLRHNTTGFTKNRALSKDKLEDPNAEMAQQAGPAAAAEYPEVEEEGQDADLGYTYQEQPTPWGSGDPGPAYPRDLTYGSAGVDTEVSEAAQELDEDFEEEGEMSKAVQGNEDEEHEHEDEDDGSRAPGQAMGGIGKGKNRAQQSSTSVSDRVLPKLKVKAGTPIVKVRFTRHNGVVCFKTRSGKLAEMKEKDWEWMEYKGRQMLVRRGGKTVYIADDVYVANT
ncbi:uncharacterized protein THITE_2112160 [Thermothielavioides terrestris NRRL 8126]|uniref:Uncharacterized protein n=1 Tax=Thermothielavioides terrestris (strain ATCC 38088 / NRRL 8126) TaxID=578455 RepID=G2R528_THETT|nr:uncharacterized protein THITE_2112160 [Thermothielavioides terrestris NRRL 8126]AEO65305.1 hypothetical protein THITE_2112160 [Thermothielavioides terrestris NRRL 8126]